MPTFFAKFPQNTNQNIELSPEDERHLIKVLRVRAGEIISLTDNRGTLARAEIISTQPLELKLLDTKPGEKPASITVYLPLIEQDRLEMAVEKLTELNMEAIQLLITARTQLKSLKPNKMARLEKVAQSAQKQCRRAWPIKILEAAELKKITLPENEIKIVGSLEKSAQNPATLNLKNHSSMIHIFVGPEGGFSPTEEKFLTENKFAGINCGETVLRAETAAIVLAAWTKMLLTKC